MQRFTHYFEFKLLGFFCCVVGFASKLIFERSSAKQIFTQKFESPSFQNEYQTNWKVNASSRGIQSISRNAAFEATSILCT